MTGYPNTFYSTEKGTPTPRKTLEKRKEYVRSEHA